MINTHTPATFAETSKKIIDHMWDQMFVLVHKITISCEN